MNIPKKLRIVSTMWEVKEVSGDTDYLGQSDFDKRLIHIKEKMNPEQTARTIFHEVCHGILDEYGARLNKDIEEKVVRAIENGFAAFAKDHQKLFIEIIKEMGKV